MTRVRKPSVAGGFYPANGQKLKQEIENYLSDAKVSNLNSDDILGTIVPHAGYMYSGQCAAYSYNVLKNKEFELAVFLAPSHRYGDFYYSVGDYDTYETPLGEVLVDKENANELLKDSNFVFYPYAHRLEHSIEVQLPFLQVINPKAKILPILIGNQYDKNSYHLSEKLANLFSDKMEKTVFICSSDLSHYHNAKTAEQLDSRVIAAVELLDDEQLWKLISNKKAEACGFGGILTLIRLAKIMKYDKVKTLNYTHSGNISGDMSQVVGYLSSVIYR